MCRKIKELGCYFLAKMEVKGWDWMVGRRGAFNRSIVQIINTLRGTNSIVQNHPLWGKMLYLVRFRKQQYVAVLRLKENKCKFFSVLFHFYLVFIVVCRGVWQLRGLVPVLWLYVPLRYKACKSFLSTKDPSDVKWKKTWLTKLTHFYLISLWLAASMQ